MFHLIASRSFLPSRWLTCRFNRTILWWSSLYFVYFDRSCCTSRSSSIFPTNKRSWSLVWLSTKATINRSWSSHTMSSFDLLFVVPIVEVEQPSRFVLCPSTPDCPSSSQKIEWRTDSWISSTSFSSRKKTSRGFQSLGFSRGPRLWTWLDFFDMWSKSEKRHQCEIVSFSTRFMSKFREIQLM